METVEIDECRHYYLFFLIFCFPVVCLPVLHFFIGDDHRILKSVPKIQVLSLIDQIVRNLPQENQHNDTQRFCGYRKNYGDELSSFFSLIFIYSSIFALAANVSLLSFALAIAISSFFLLIFISSPSFYIVLGTFVLIGPSINTVILIALIN